MADPLPPEEPARPRVVIYVQHLLGTGHLVRMRLLARALDAAGAQVTLISGGMPVAGDARDQYEQIQLEPVRTLPGDFSTLVDAAGVTVPDAELEARSETLRQTVLARRPQAVVIETWPFGRRRMAFEIVPMARAFRGATSSPLTVSSIRDVLQLRKPTRRQESLDQIAGYIDLVLVHGDETVTPLVQSFEEADQIHCPVRYTGYLQRPESERVTAPASSAESGGVLVSAGGGAAGMRLLDTALGAAIDDTRRWHILAGTCPDTGWLHSARKLIEESAQAERIVVEANRPDFQDLLAGCAVSISQFGYNTALDVIRANRPAVVVPYAQDGETEQTMRASLFAERGVVTVLSEDRLAAGSMLEAINKAVAAHQSGKLAKPKIRMSGAATAAGMILEAIGNK